MNHDEAVRLLDEYVDGLLSNERREAMEEHLRRCDRCARELAGTRELLGRAAALPREIAPERDLWAGIAARLDGETAAPRSAGHHAPLRLAGYATVAVAAALLVIVLARGGGTSPGGAGSTAYRTARAGLAFVGVARECLEMERDLFRLARADDGEERDAVLADISLGLNQVDAAIAQAKGAWARRPDDASLTHRLARLYETKARLEARGAREAAGA